VTEVPRFRQTVVLVHAHQRLQISVSGALSVADSCNHSSRTFDDAPRPPDISVSSASGVDDSCTPASDRPSEVNLLSSAFQILICRPSIPSSCVLNVELSESVASLSSFWPFPVFQEHVFRREHQQEDDDAEDKHEHGLDDLKYV